jgi:hypothetical protein
MAISGIKITKKKPRAAVRVKRGSKISEPSWEGCLDMSGEDYHKFRRNTSMFYYQNYKPADLYPSIFKWMEEIGEYSKEDIASAKESPNTYLSVTASIYARMMTNGMPDTNPKHDVYWAKMPGCQGDAVKPVSEFIDAQVLISIREGAKVLQVKNKEAKDTANVYVPSIQERIRDQALIQSEEIDEWLEGWTTDKKTFDPKGFDFKTHFSKSGVTQAHARKIKGFFENELTDFEELAQFPTAGKLKKMSELEQDLWAQLKEGYAHIKKADIKTYTTAIQELLTALDFVIESAKATRAPRKAKPKSADKLVSKLKYLKTDDKFKLASVRPEDIIGASELWVFNTKTRKLGKYIAKNIDPKGLGRDGSGLSVKGTTIIGYDETHSIQKTMRKPADQIAEFKKAGKVKLRSFLDDIKTTDTKLNGRCNPETILLKVS